MIRKLHHAAYRCRNSEETRRFHEDFLGLTFEAPDMPFEFKPRHDYDLHIALEVDPRTLGAMFEAGKRKGIETRGVSTHGFVDSIYLRDPNGYVVELCARAPGHDEAMDPGINNARQRLEAWNSRAAQP